MKSGLAKPLYPLAHRPMIDHVLAATATLSPSQTLIVTSKALRKDLSGRKAKVIVQHPPRGTGDAVRTALKDLARLRDADVIITYADTPLISAQSLKKIVRRLHNDAPGVLCTVRMQDQLQEFGRVMIDPAGHGQAVIEKKDLKGQDSPFGCAGLFGFRLSLLRGWLGRVRATGKEVYLTSVPALAYKDKSPLYALEIPFTEALGVNSQTDLARAEGLMQERLRAQAMARGVRLMDPASTFLAADTVLGRDVTIEPFVMIGPGVRIDAGAYLYCGCRIEHTHLRRGASLGPFCVARGGTVLRTRASLGSFVEAKNADLAPGAKARHLAYLGDTVIGKDVNIGAGVITCNYDGFQKHQTTIKPGAFIGSNSALIAPVQIGKNSVVGAGTIVTRDIPADAIALTRPNLELRPGAAKRRRWQKNKSLHQNKTPKSSA